MNTKVRFMRIDERKETEGLFELGVILEKNFLKNFAGITGFAVAGAPLIENWGFRFRDSDEHRIKPILFSSERAKRWYKQAVIQEVQDAVDFLAQKNEDKEKDSDKDPDEVVVFSSQQRDKEEV